MFCNGSEPTADVPCELGALAVDPDGGPRGGALNLTDEVIACPPSQCLTSKGCTEKVRRGIHVWAIWSDLRSGMGAQGGISHNWG